MDEENKQVTAEEVYSYGESTEEPAGEPEENHRHHRHALLFFIFQCYDSAIVTTLIVIPDAIILIQPSCLNV